MLSPAVVWKTTGGRRLCVGGRVSVVVGRLERTAGHVEPEDVTGGPVQSHSHLRPITGDASCDNGPVQVHVGVEAIFV